MPLSPIARRMFAEWSSLPKPSRRLTEKVQSQGEINSVLSDPDDPLAAAWRKAQSDHDARYFADANDDAPDPPLTAEEVAATDWTAPRPRKTAADRARREAVLDAMDAHAKRPDPAA